MSITTPYKFPVGTVSAKVAAERAGVTKEDVMSLINRKILPAGDFRGHLYIREAYIARIQEMLKDSPPRHRKRK